MLKICHVVWGMSLGGTENMLCDIIDKQVSQAEITLIVIDRNVSRDLLSSIDKRVNIVLLNRRQGKRSLRAVARLNWCLLQGNFHIIHCHTPSILRMVLVRGMISAKICATVHDTGINFPQLSRYDKVFSISPAVSADIISRYGFKPCLVINGIDFSKIKARTAGQQKGKVFSIIQISRLDHEKKGQDVLLRAMHALLYEHKVSGVRATFVGDGPSRDFLISLAEELKIRSHCDFIGAKNREWIYEKLREYDLLVQPSNYEGFGLTVAEGMAALLPVLVSDIEGPGDIVQYGKYGYVFRRGDSTDLAMKIQLVRVESLNPGFTDATKTNYNYARKHFDVSDTACAYLIEYSRLQGLSTLDRQGA